MAKQVWGKHATVATGTNVPSKQVSVDVWNESLNRKGLLGFDSETIASASEITIPADTSSDSSDGSTSSFIKLSGSTDVDKFIVTNTSEGDLLWVITTGSATLVNVTSPSSGEIRLLANDDKDLSTTVPTVLMRVGNSWYEYGGQLNSTHSVSANDLTGTTLASGVVTTAATTVGALNSGSITSGFGTIDTGSSAISTTGTVTTGGLTIGGDIGTAAAQDWDLIDNTADALSFDSTGKAGILKFVTTDGSEGITMSGTLGVTGTITGDLTGDVTGDVSGSSGSTTGNAATATTAATVTGGTQASITTCANLVESGALNAGSITSGFGTINTGSSTITTTGALGSGAITTSGTLTMGDNIITGIKRLDTDVDTLAYAAERSIDFDTNEEIILGELTGNIEFTATNYGLGKHKTIHMVSDGSARTFTFPSGWVFYGTEPTTTVASKKSVLSLSCLGSAEADVRAVFVEEV